MKVLLIAWYFPPTSTIAAVRLGGLAAFLRDQGHDVRVIAPRGLPYSQTLALGIPESDVSYTGWIDVNAPPRWAASLAKRLFGRSRKATVASHAPSVGSSNATSSRGTVGGLAERLTATYARLLNWPDAQIGWLPFAFLAGIRALRGWRPDIVLASGPPFTTLVIGRALSLWSGAPWVIEFRDRWSDDPYYPPPPWRRRLLAGMERRLVASSLGLVTVSEPWAETYRQRCGKPTAVVCNGYDEGIDEIPASRPKRDARVLRIVYTGGIYPGRRDPTPLFQAISRLGETACCVHVEFYGTRAEQVMPLAEAANVVENVTVLPEVTHRESVAVQRGADVLLLMQWNDPKEQGNVPGKFFEYLGARRPILVLGLEDGVPATIVRERQAGFYGADPEAIADQLSLWIKAKAEEGEVATVPEDGRSGYSRKDQYRKMQSFLLSLSAETDTASVGWQPSGTDAPAQSTEGHKP